LRPPEGGTVAARASSTQLMRGPHLVGHYLQLNPAINEYSLRVKHPPLYQQKPRIRGTGSPGAWRRGGESRYEESPVARRDVPGKFRNETEVSGSRRDRSNKVEKLILVIRATYGTEHSSTCSRQLAGSSDSQGQTGRIHWVHVAAECLVGSADRRTRADCGRSAQDIGHDLRCTAPRPRSGPGGSWRVRGWVPPGRADRLATSMLRGELGSWHGHGRGASGVKPTPAARLAMSAIRGPGSSGQLATSAVVVCPGRMSRSAATSMIGVEATETAG
jgi:hypothetical protein